MKTIRRGVFETNSSSCHSLSISEDNLNFTTLSPDNNGILILDIDYEFGWGPDKCSGVEAMFAYLYVCARDTGKDVSVLQNIIKVVKEHTKAKQVIVKNEMEGYIDHQSIDLALEYLHSDETIKQFIFGIDNHIILDNDNH